MDEATIMLVTRWQAGDQQAADELFKRYAERLIALARSRLSPKLSSRVDPEDVVQSAYRSFFAGARENQYDLQRGGALWRLLVTITLCKLQDQVKHHTADKRNVAAERSFGTEDSLHGIHAQLAQEASPLAAVALVEEVERFMRGLEAGERRILELRLQGSTLYEISQKTSRSVATVSRVLSQLEERLSQSVTGTRA